MTSSSSRRTELAAALLALSFLATVAGQGAGAVDPTASHASPGAVKTGEAIPLTLAVDPGDKYVNQVVLEYWTSLTTYRTPMSLEQSIDAPGAWTCEIPGQSSPCEVRYSFTVHYMSIGIPTNGTSARILELPGNGGHYVVTVEGSIMDNVTPLGVGVAIVLLLLAVGLIIYAHRLGSKWGKKKADEGEKREDGPNPDGRKKKARRVPIEDDDPTEPPPAS